MGHVDGSECLDGIKCDVPEGYNPCCDSFNRRLSECVYDLRIEWYPKQGNWGIVLTDGSYICIHYCPFCGSKLKQESQEAS